MKKKVYLSTNSPTYLFLEHWERTLTLEQADLVLFTGGADVTPSLYGHYTHPSSHCIKKRDMNEAYLFKKALDNGIPMLGICRGSQFGTVMNGGKLFQDVSNHTRPHSIKINNQNLEFLVTSTHHQMMDIRDLNAKDYELIAYSENLSEYYISGSQRTPLKLKKLKIEPEIVYYPNTNFLAIQCHPEMMDYKLHHEFIDWIDDLIDEKLFE